MLKPIKKINTSPNRNHIRLAIEIEVANSPEIFAETNSKTSVPSLIPKPPGKINAIIPITVANGNVKSIK